MQNKHKQLKPGLVTFYIIQPGNAVDLSSKEKISAQVKKNKRRSIKDINKQTIYSAEINNRINGASCQWNDNYVSALQRSC